MQPGVYPTRTVQPSVDKQPKLNLNVLKMIQDYAPRRLEEIAAEIKSLQDRMVALGEERQKLISIHEIAAPDAE